MTPTVAAKKKDKIKLNLGERIAISTMLPLEGNYTFHVIKKDLLKKIGVSQEEIEKYKIKENFGEDKKISWLTWNDKGIKASFEYEFTELEKNEIKLSLIKVSEDNKLMDNLVNIYEIFVGKQ